MAEYTYPYERAAMLGLEMPEGLDLPDQVNFLGLYSLYAQVRAGTMDRATGSAEKKKLGRQRDLWMERLHAKEKLAQHCAKMFRDIEAAANAYAKERTLENADRLYRALYRMEVRNEQ